MSRCITMSVDKKAKTTYDLELREYRLNSYSSTQCNAWKATTNMET
jgi:hypothetical protein